MPCFTRHRRHPRRLLWPKGGSGGAQPGSPIGPDVTRHRAPNRHLGWGRAGGVAAGPAGPVASASGGDCQRPPDAAIGPGNQNCPVCDAHHDDDLLFLSGGSAGRRRRCGSPRPGVLRGTLRADACGASPGSARWWNLPPGRLRGGWRIRTELAGPGDSLGAVGRAELVQQVADVLFTVSRVTASSSAMRGFVVPAASSPRTSRSRAVSCSTRSGTAGAASGVCAASGPARWPAGTSSFGAGNGTALAGGLCW